MLFKTQTFISTFFKNLIVFTVAVACQPDIKTSVSHSRTSEYNKNSATNNSKDQSHDPRQELALIELDTLKPKDPVDGTKLQIKSLSLRNEEESSEKILTIYIEPTDPENTSYIEFAICNEDNQCQPSKESPEKFVLFTHSYPDAPKGNLAVHVRACTSFPIDSQKPCGTWLTERLLSEDIIDAQNLEILQTIYLVEQEIIKLASEVRILIQDYIEKASKNLGELTEERKKFITLGKNILTLSDEEIGALFSQGFLDEIQGQAIEETVGYDPESPRAIEASSAEQEDKQEEDKNDDQKDMLIAGSVIMGIGAASVIGSIVLIKYGMPRFGVEGAYQTPEVNKGKYPTFAMASQGWYKDNIHRVNGGKIEKTSTKGSPYSVEYIDDENVRKQYEVEFDKGKNQWVWADDSVERKSAALGGSTVPAHNKGEPVSFVDEKGNQKSFIGVMDQDGRIYMGTKAELEFHHSSFLGGKPAAAAFTGKMAKEGDLLRMTPASGHYTPTKTMFDNLKKEMATKMGVPPAELDSKFHFKSPDWKTNVKIWATKATITRIDGQKVRPNFDADPVNFRRGPQKGRSARKMGGLVGGGLVFLGGIIAMTVGAVMVSNAALALTNSEEETLEQKLLYDLAKIKYRIDELFQKIERLKDAMSLPIAEPVYPDDV